MCIYILDAWVKCNLKSFCVTKSWLGEIYSLSRYHMGTSSSRGSIVNLYENYENLSEEYYLSPSNVAVHTCPQCGRSFKWKQSYRHHLRIHSGEKPYVCPVCNRGFSDPSNCKRHIKLHSDNRPYHCGLCNASFSRRQHLVTHQVTVCFRNSVEWMFLF